jgi:hypothetical protein
VDTSPLKCDKNTKLKKKKKKTSLPTNINSLEKPEVLELP